MEPIWTPVGWEHVEPLPAAIDSGACSPTAIAGGAGRAMADPGQRHRAAHAAGRRRPHTTLAALMVLAGCSSSPIPRTYVLNPPAEPAVGVHNEADRPVVELPTVTLPDYLDTTDILVRDGRNELKPSTTGQWGERLSVGITQTLRTDLARRLPGVLVTRSALSGQPARRVLVNVTAFDVRPDGQCVLTARWTIPGGNPGTVAVAEAGTFISATGDIGAAGVAGSSGSLADAAIVAAMAADVDQLADRIAVSLRRGHARPR